MAKPSLRLVAYLDGGHETSLRTYRERHSVIASCVIDDTILELLTDAGLYDDVVVTDESKPPLIESCDCLMDVVSDFTGDDRYDQRVIEQMRLVAQEAGVTGVGLVALIRGNP